MFKPAPLPLPDEWIKHLFKTMSLHYGSRFTNMWSGNDASELKAFWAKGLGCFADTPEAIRHGLDHLPDGQPPTMQEFKKLCFGFPRLLPALPSPKANPAIVAQVLTRLNSKPAQQISRLTWAEKLRSREQAGEILSPFQKQSWRSVLRDPSEAR